MESNKRRVISLLVDNQSGVLARVSNPVLPAAASTSTA